MKAVFSEYLQRIAPDLKRLTALLKEKYDYVSILASDSTGFNLRVSKRVTTASGRTMTTERGIVVRVCRQGLYSEYAMNADELTSPEETARRITDQLDRQLAVLEKMGTQVYTTGILPDEPCTMFVEAETGSMPETTDLAELMKKLKEICSRGMELGEDMIDCIVSAQSTHICKLFLTPCRDMRQSYVYSEGTVVPVVSRDGKTEMSYCGVSGRKGPEIFDELSEVIQKQVKLAEELLDAQAVEPGEYDIITTPEVTGLIAHEAFGHGVEMDMFVKDRALGASYIGKRVGSDLVTMHEGALCADSVTGYYFDDEGNLAGDVTEIDQGILKTGICDALSAMRLGTTPTGNGKRENFEHKVYTRMTNTLFDSGNSTLEEMIASVDYGYLLQGMKSGMEDPKHWGIQCLIERGYEIRDGRLTGKVVAPVIMTGYVPDLLGSISMVSRDREVFGNGGCGKGHKEWVKVADGGPCLKARARLG